MSVQQFRELIEQLDLNDSEVEERLKELAERDLMLASAKAFVECEEQL